jgi:hypothetical protein
MLQPLFRVHGRVAIGPYVLPLATEETDMTTTKSKPAPQLFARLKDLIAGTKDVEGMFRNMGSLLESSGLDAVMRFEVSTGKTKNVYALHVNKGSSSVARPSGPAHAHLELLLEESTWRDIAGGTLAPLQALANGKMRVRGDMRLGVRIMHHLAGTPGRIDIC